MRTLWLRMAHIYGSRWTSAYGEDAQTGAGETWAKGLVGVDARQLAVGLEACIVRADPWPPTLPEFRSLCLGVPSLFDVRADLEREHAERQPFTVMVGRRLDGWAYRRADARQAEAMLREAYADAREAVMRGETLPAPLEAVTHAPAPVKPASPEVARAAMAEAMAALGMATPEDRL